MNGCVGKRSVGVSSMEDGVKKLLRERKVFNGAALWAFKILCCCLLGFQRLKFSSNVRLYLKEPCMKWSFFFFEERECLCMCVCRVELSLSVSLGLDFSKREEGKEVSLLQAKGAKGPTVKPKTVGIFKKLLEWDVGTQPFSPPIKNHWLGTSTKVLLFQLFSYHVPKNSKFKLRQVRRL